MRAVRLRSFGFTVSASRAIRGLGFGRRVSSSGFRAMSV